MRKTVAVVVALALASGTAFANDESAPREIEERSPVWMPMFLSSAVLVIGGASIYAYGVNRIDDEADQVRLEGMTGTITEQDCDRQNLRDADRHFDSACTWSRRTKYAALGTLIMLPVAIVSGYMAFRSPPTKEKRSVALVPTVTTQSAGAMLDVRW